VINGSTLWIVAQVYSWIVWMRAWIHRLVQRVVQRQRNIIIMDDNYTGNGSNNANGFQIVDSFWTHEVHTTIHIQNRVILRNKNDKNSLRTMEMKHRQQPLHQGNSR
jgi:hypothetical protein